MDMEKHRTVIERKAEMWRRIDAQEEKPLEKTFPQGGLLAEVMAKHALTEAEAADIIEELGG